MCIKYKIFSLRFKTELMSVEKSTVQNNIHNT